MRAANSRYTASNYREHTSKYFSAMALALLGAGIKLQMFCGIH
jgi:hypothetical protein